MYGIRPRKYKTFSGLFCLNKDSYNLGSNQFREICVGLYNYEIEKENKSEESQKNAKMKKIIIIKKYWKNYLSLK